MWGIGGSKPPPYGKTIIILIRKRKDLIMDRVELRKFLDKEQAAALGWYENAKKSVMEAEKGLEEVREYLRSKVRRSGRAAITHDELAQFKEAKALVREAREELIFFDGVKQATDAIANRIRGNMAREELANAGKWVINPIKPRRR